MYKTIYLLLIFYPSTYVFADMFTIDNKRLTRYYVIKNHTFVYSKPDIKSKQLKTLKKGNTFQYSKKHYTFKITNNFIPYSKLTNNKILKGWVKRDNLITDHEFKKIKANWPFKKIEYEFGDAFHYMNFKSNGKGFTVNNIGKDLHTNVYQFGNLIKIQYLMDKKWLKNQESYISAFIFIYNKKNNKLNLVNSDAYLKYETYNK